MNYCQYSEIKSMLLLKMSNSAPLFCRRLGEEKENKGQTRLFTNSFT
jgi:hypothetical protein